MTKNSRPERMFQFKICCFIDENFPDTLYTTSIAGLKLPKNLGSTLSACGYRRGTPDLMIFEARCGYHGLFLELKSDKGILSDDQKQFIDDLTKRDYLALVFHKKEREKAEYSIKKYLQNENIFSQKT